MFKVTKGIQAKMHVAILKYGLLNTQLMHNFHSATKIKTEYSTLH